MFTLLQVGRAVTDGQDRTRWDGEPDIFGTAGIKINARTWQFTRPFVV